MTTTLFAKAGDLRPMLDVIKTATDWQAEKIVVHGALDEYVRGRLDAEYATYEIPVTEEDVPEAIVEMLTDENVVIVNEVLNTVQARPRSRRL